MEKIKKLREQTGAGISDCKKALEEAGGDIERAVEILRKKGISKAAKREGREASEGIVLVDVNQEGNQGYIVEINSETDFVARNEKFKDFSKKILELIKAERPAGTEELLNKKMKSGATVGEELDNLSGVLGEKLEIKRMDILNGEKVAAYSHFGGKIGALVSFSGEISAERAVDIAMQIVAVNPRYINPEDIPAEELQKEKNIYREQLKKEGKSEDIIERIIEGKIKKYYEEVCLVNQEFIKDDKKKVGDVLGGVKVEKFIRYSLKQ